VIGALTAVGLVGAIGWFCAIGIFRMCNRMSGLLHEIVDAVDAGDVGAHTAADKEHLKQWRLDASALLSGQHRQRPRKTRSIP
jgi:hypothetical protein